MGITFCFEKVLTSSDANGSGRVVLPKVRALLLAGQERFGSEMACQDPLDSL